MCVAALAANGGFDRHMELTKNSSRPLNDGLRVLRSCGRSAVRGARSSCSAAVLGRGLGAAAWGLAVWFSVRPTKHLHRDHGQNGVHKGTRLRSTADCLEGGVMCPGFLVMYWS